MGSWLALAIDAAARVQHTQTTRLAMKGDLAVSWVRGVWASVSDNVRVGLARLFAGSHTLYRRPIISACWILKWWVSTANRSAFVVLICRWVLNLFPNRHIYDGCRAKDRKSISKVDTSRVGGPSSLGVGGYFEQLQA